MKKYIKSAAEIAQDNQDRFIKSIQDQIEKNITNNTNTSETTNNAVEKVAVKLETAINILTTSMNTSIANLMSTLKQNSDNTHKLDRKVYWLNLILVIATVIMSSAIVIQAYIGYLAFKETRLEQGYKQEIELQRTRIQEIQKNEMEMESLLKRFNQKDKSSSKN
ncbi:MAG TPA: hypothetical protein VLX68_02685 [Chitinivibrionales bacterium]|nr:hypothetical protein [Chitinivibrionales bacterium]